MSSSCKLRQFSFRNDKNKKRYLQLSINGLRDIVILTAIDVIIGVKPGNLLCASTRCVNLSFIACIKLTNG